MKMHLHIVEFYEALGDGQHPAARFSFAISWSEKIPAGVHILATATPIDTPRIPVSAAGFSVCAREDLDGVFAGFDLSVGVALALKRCLRQIPKINRKSVTRQFYKVWPETHPYYRVKRLRAAMGRGATTITVTNGLGLRTGDAFRCEGELHKVTRIE
jgi:hypothetical protein